MPRRIDHDGRRRDVAEITCTLIASHGFEWATVRRVAQAARCSTKVVSHYFNPAHALSYGVIGNGGKQGALSEYMVIARADADAAIIPVSSSLPAELAALAEPLAVGLHAVNRAEVTSRQHVAVLGVGCIGMSIIAGLRARGIDDIIAVDVSPMRLEAARRLDARSVIHATTENVRERLESLHGKEYAFGMLPAVSTDIYFDTAASAHVLRDTISMARRQALIVYVGLYTGDVSLDLMQALHREVDLRAAVAYEDEFSEALQLLGEPMIEFEAMISHRFPLEQFGAAFGIAKDPRATRAIAVARAVVTTQTHEENRSCPSSSSPAGIHVLSTAMSSSGSSAV